MGKRKQDETLARSLCWHCESEVGGKFFCEQCVKIQPITQEEDHFKRLGLPRRLQIDLNDLEKRYYDRSRQFHPDFFHHKSNEEKQISLQNSSLLNSAYRTLKNPIRRAEYLISLEEGAVKEIPAKAPPELLEEVLELQEAIEAFRELQNQNGDLESRSEEEEKIILEQKAIQSRREALDRELNACFEQWDRFVGAGGGDEEKKKEGLARMREILSERTYLQNILNEIDTALMGAV